MYVLPLSVSSQLSSSSPCHSAPVLRSTGKMLGRLGRAGCTDSSEQVTVHSVSLSLSLRSGDINAEVSARGATLAQAAPHPAIASL